MKKLSLALSVLLVVSCHKSKPTETVTPDNGGTTSGTSPVTIAAKINNRPWQSAAKTTTDTNVYYAALNDATLQIKTFGSFADSGGAITQDQLAIYLTGVTDTGVYSLTTSSYIAYNQLSTLPQYFSSQMANIGSVHITSLTDSTVSGTFEGQVNNTSGSGTVLIRDGAFANVPLQ